MKTMAITGLAGALCLPAVYSLVRGGSFVVAIAVVIVISVVGTGVAILAQNKRGPRLTWWRAPTGFMAGAFASELVFFTYYYISYGHDDPKLAVGIAVVIIEFGVIAVSGGIVACIGSVLYNSIRKRG